MNTYLIAANIWLAALIVMADDPPRWQKWFASIAFIFYVLLGLINIAWAAPADHRCLDPTRTIISLPAGDITNPRTVDVKSKLSTTIDARQTTLTCSIKDGNKDCLEITGVTGRADSGTETCLIGANIRSPDMANATWEQIKKCCDKGAVGIRRPKGDFTLAYSNLGLAEDPMAMPRPHEEHSDGANLKLTIEHAVLKAKDEPIENDGCGDVSAKDVYARGHYIPISVRPSAGNHYIPTRQPVIRFENLLAELVCQPDTRSGVNECLTQPKMSHAGFWKWTSKQSTCSGNGFKEPLLQLAGRVWLYVENIPAGGPSQLSWPSALEILPGADVAVFWGNEKVKYPGKLPKGVRLVTGVAATQEFAAAREQFRLDHGCTADWSKCTWEAAALPPEPIPEPPTLEERLERLEKGQDVQNQRLNKLEGKP